MNNNYLALKEFEGYIERLQGEFPGLAIKGIYAVSCYDCGNLTGELKVMLNKPHSEELDNVLFELRNTGKYRIYHSYSTSPDKQTDIEDAQKDIDEMKKRIAVDPASLHRPINT